jgi:hypothetical protein
MTSLQYMMFARPPADVTDPDLRLDDEEKSIAELASFRRRRPAAYFSARSRRWLTSSAITVQAAPDSR